MLESVSSLTALWRNSLTAQVASIPLNHRVVWGGVSLLLMVMVVSTSLVVMLVVVVVVVWEGLWSGISQLFL